MATELNYKEGEVIANKYVIESFLERSSSGQCYLCSENYSQEKMCVKLYNATFSQELLSSPNFFLKAGATTQVEHPNMVKVFEINSEVNQVYVARQYVKGANLAEWKSQFPDSGETRKKAVEIIWQAAQGLSAIHEQGKHFQLHPHNIIVGELGAIITDWDPRGMTDVDINKYMPVLSLYEGYRAPEFLQSRTEVYPNADLYSLGAALYFLLTGFHPEVGKGRESLKVSKMPQKAIDFLMRAMDPNPGKRFQDVLSFSDELWNLTDVMDSVSPESAGLPTPETNQSSSGFDNSGLSGDDPFSSLEASFADDGPVANSPPPVPPSAPPKYPPRQTPIPETPKASFSQKAFFESQKTIVDNSFSKSNTSQNDSGGFFSSLEGGSASPPAPKKNPNKFSLEEKEYGVSQNQTQASYTMFGFKGIQGGHTVVQPSENGKKARNWILVGLAAVGGTAFVIILALLIHQVLNKDGADASLKEDESSLQLGGGLSETEDVADASAFEEPLEEPENTMDASAEEALDDMDKATQEFISSSSTDKNTSAASEPTSKYKGNYKVSAERETQIMKMYATGKWPSSAGECLAMADDLNDLSRVREANRFYNQALEYGDVSFKEKLHAYGALGITYKKLGDVSKAKESFQALLSLDASNSFAQKQLSLLP